MISRFLFASLCFCALFVFQVNGFLGTNAKLFSKSFFLRVSSTVIRDKDQDLESEKSRQKIVKFEQCPMKVTKVSSLSKIIEAAKTTERTVSSKEFCVRSGGYPDRGVRNDIYLHLLASVTYQLENEIGLQYTNEGNITDELEFENLFTFGLV